MLRFPAATRHLWLCSQIYLQSHLSTRFSCGAKALERALRLAGSFSYNNDATHGLFLSPFLRLPNLSVLRPPRTLLVLHHLRQTVSTRSPSLISSAVLSRIAFLHTNFLVWSPAPLNLMFYKCCPDLFSGYASLKLTAWETLHPQLLIRFTPLRLKSSLSLLVLLFCNGLLIPNQTSSRLPALY